MLIGAICVFGFFEGRTYYKAHLMRWVAVQTIVLVVLIVCATLIFNKRIFHAHHWTIGLILCSYLSYQDVLTAVLHGFCNGVMIEGGTRWGFDWVWERDPKHPEYWIG